MNKIKKRQLEFLGHMCQSQGLEHQLSTDKIEVKETEEVQRTTYIDNSRRLRHRNNAGIFIQKADERENWKTMIVNVIQIRHY